MGTDVWLLDIVFILVCNLLLCDDNSFFWSDSERVVLANSSVIRSVVLFLFFFFFFFTSVLTEAPGIVLDFAASNASCLALCSAINSGLAPIGYIGLFFICLPLLSYLKGNDIWYMIPKRKI